MSAISNLLNQIKTAIYGEQVRDAIHDSILQCYTDVTNGVTLAQNAASSAGRAATDANGAANQASAAAYNASNAASSATTAANAATAAANNASNAKEAANAAAQVATSAANQANDAASAANTAKTNADTATQAANTAAGAANTAAEAANTAATNANTAKNDAVAATEAATTAAETINGKAPGVVENASGAIASFSDGSDNVPVKKLEVNIEPVQDLHGYDSPWPGGGGKNILNITEGTKTINGVTFTVNADKTITLSGIASDTNDAVFKQNLSVSDFPSDTIILNGCPSGGNYYNKYSMALCDMGGRLINNKSDVGSGAEYSAEMLKSVSQLQIIVRKGTDANRLVFKPMIRLATETDGTFVPYSNICPIEGWTEVKVEKSGFNLWDEEWENGTFNTSTGSNIIMPDQIRSKNLIEVKPGASYYINAPGDEGIWIAYFDRDMKILTNNQTTDGNAKTKASNCLLYRRAIMTVSDLCHYIRFYCTKSYGATYKNDICINLSDPAHNGEYEPYQGETYDISLPSEAGIVYGGTLDVASGLLTVDMVSETFDGSADEDWKTGSASRNYKYIYTKHSMKYTTQHIPMYAISNMAIPIAQSVSFSTIDYAAISRQGNNNILWFILKDVTDTMGNQDFKVWLSEHPLQVVYELATPLTYHLTPTQVKTILGENNIFADTGDVNVDYIADTKLYIDKKFTELQALMLENVGG